MDNNTPQETNTETKKRSQKKRTSQTSHKKTQSTRTVLKPVAHRDNVMAKTVTNVQKGLKNPKVTDTIAKGAAGVAITAGVVAAGAALMNKDTRKKVGKTAKLGLNKLSEYATMIAEEGAEQYKPVASEINTPKQQTTSKRSKKSSRAKR